MAEILKYIPIEGLEGRTIDYVTKTVTTEEDIIAIIFTDGT